MKATLFVLPALAHICYGAALPQAIVTETIAVPEPPAAYTVTIPCYADTGDCVARTVTLYGRDAEGAAVLPEMIMH